MPSFVDDVKTEWRRFATDAPGARFEHRYERLRQSSKVWIAIRFLIGVVLLAIGVVLLFVPGPGLLVMLFGVAMFATQWRRLARLLDRAEPRVRRGFGALQRRWRGAAWPVKAAFVAVAVAATIGTGYAAWHYWS